VAEPVLMSETGEGKSKWTSDIRMNIEFLNLLKSP
jgi:hypothetical protein